MRAIAKYIISPASDDVIEKYFGCKYLIKAERCQKRFKNGRDLEVDVLVICEDNLIKYTSKKGLYLMAYREWDYMDIINFDMVKKTP